MKCNSCSFPIRKGEKAILCDVCQKDVHKECAIIEDGKVYCDSCYMSKTEDDNNPILDVEVPEVIRRSYIQLYKTCPFKFYNEVILGHKQPENIYAKIGIELHDLFDKANTNKSYKIDEMKDDMLRNLTYYPKELYTGSLNEEWAVIRAMSSIDTYYHVTKDMPELFASEETLQFSVGEDLPMVQATSDRVNRIGDDLHVLDWKTGNVIVGKAISSDLQAPLYIHSIREKYNLPVKTFTFYYLKDNKIRQFEQISDDKYVCKVGKREYFISITEAIREVQQIFSKVKSAQFNIPTDAKNMYYHCKMCHIKEKGLCEGSEMQSWNQYNK